MKCKYWTRKNTIIRVRPLKDSSDMPGYDDLLSNAQYRNKYIMVAANKERQMKTSLQLQQQQ